MIFKIFQAVVVLCVFKLLSCIFMYIAERNERKITDAVRQNSFISNQLLKFDLM